jgi:hypothetical protein
MYYVANLETRAILTHADGSRMIRTLESLARDDAIRAQELSGHPHCVVPICDNSNALRREVAPWIKKS